MKRCNKTLWNNHEIYLRNILFFWNYLIHSVNSRANKQEREKEYAKTWLGNFHFFIFTYKNSHVFFHNLKHLKSKINLKLLLCLLLLLLSTYPLQLLLNGINYRTRAHRSRSIHRRQWRVLLMNRQLWLMINASTEWSHQVGIALRLPSFDGWNWIFGRFTWISSEWSRSIVVGFR